MSKLKWQFILDFCCYVTVFYNITVFIASGFTIINRPLTHGGDNGHNVVNMIHGVDYMWWRSTCV